MLDAVKRLDPRSRGMVPTGCHPLAERLGLLSCAEERRSPALCNQAEQVGPFEGLEQTFVYEAPARFIEPKRICIRDMLVVPVPA